MEFLCQEAASPADDITLTTTSTATRKPIPIMPVIPGRIHMTMVLLSDLIRASIG
jgi:hypothetical protein